MKIGKTTEIITKGLCGGGLATAASTQVAVLSHSATALGLANLSGTTAVAAQTAGVGLSIFGPFATAASSVFGSAGWMSGFFASAFGAGLISGLIVPLMAIGMAVVAYKGISQLARLGGTTIDNIAEAREQKKLQQTTDRTTPTPQIGQEKSDISPAPAQSASKEEPWHPALDAEKRGVSHTANLTQSRNTALTPSRA